MVEPITLDGRRFSQQPDSTAQRGYIIDHLRLANAIEIMSDLEGKTRTEEQRAEELLTQILLSGQKPHILAGCLTEEGHVWSREEADKNAVRFATVTDEHDILVLNRLIVQFTIALFATETVMTTPSAAESDALRRFQEFEAGDQAFVN